MKPLLQRSGQHTNLLILLIVISLFANLLTLAIPRITQSVIDSLDPQAFSYELSTLVGTYLPIAFTLFLLSLLQTVLSSLLSERVAYSQRLDLISKLKNHSNSYIAEKGVDQIITNITSDVDSVKLFISQGLTYLLSAVVLLIGATVLLVYTDWKLALPVIASVPLMLSLFFFVISFLRQYFTRNQEIIDKLNEIINQTIVGAALTRILNSQEQEIKNFDEPNTEVRAVGRKINHGFAFMIPTINLLLNMSILIVVGYGGTRVINSDLSLGELSAFIGYVGLFISPILTIGFLGSQVTQAIASNERLEAIEEPSNQTAQEKQQAVPENSPIILENISLKYSNKQILEDISFQIPPGSKTAIIGPTAAGKTQLMYLIAGLNTSTNGSIYYGKTKLEHIAPAELYKNIGIVYQDSLVFKNSIRENVAFKLDISDKQIWEALDIADLADYVKTLPDGLDTDISERGTSLSGGQKQRLMLARAIVTKPAVLLLDDFTARVDIATEQRISKNLSKKLPNQTIVSITQKIAPITNYDQIVLLMNGKLVAKGTHEELLKGSFEYRQIYNSQQSTES